MSGLVFDNQIAERLRRIEQEIEEAMRDRPPIQPIIVINDVHNSIITIRERDGAFVILSDELIVCEPAAAYRLVLFDQCSNVDIRVETKLCRFSLHNCVDTRVVFTQSTIGPVEVYQCQRIELHLLTVIPVVTFELSEVINVFQNIDEMIYITKMCLNIQLQTRSGDTFTIGKHVLSNTERAFSLISIDTGITTTYSHYAMTEELGTHIIVR